jgi:hypothetical protein
MIVRRPLIYKWVDPVKGELWRPFEIVPPVSVDLSEDVLVFPNREARPITLLLRSSTDHPITGTAKLQLPAEWKSEPESISFELSERGAEQYKTVMIYPSSSPFSGILEAEIEVDGERYDRSLQMISYDHFPIQTLLPPAQMKVVRIDLKKEGETIGYIRGAGDDIPSALRNMGYQVLEMNNDEITPENLKRMDAVVLGVRALNTNERARYFMPAVLEYVKQGGTVVVQYNTNARLEAEKFSPFPIVLSHDRVTEENAEVTILKADHPVLNIPNKITANDFAGWVQERGLYFPVQWDEKYDAILSMHDRKEVPKDGSLLVARYGEGYYVYTGLSFFRQLPEGVSGAYKLFANLVSLGKHKRAEAANRPRSK